jgi:hypothetical protein
MCRVRPLLAGFVLVAGCAAPSARSTVTGAPVPPANGLSVADRVRLAEVFRLAAAIGDEIWPAWTSAPFAILLVTPDREYLLRHPSPSPEFTRLGYDSLLGTDVLARERRFAPNLLATFPAVGGVPTIVVGQPAATDKASTEWVVTLLHEHFHQLQYSRPDYQTRVDSLGLARGDQSGMWMLNFAFPYDSTRVQTLFATFTNQLDSALAATSASARAMHWVAARTARTTLRNALSPDDDRYLAFQIWQEGVSRYTELQVARFAATRYSPSAAFTRLPDYAPYAAVADSLDSHIRAGLRGDALARGHRVAFYAAGAAFALMLDHTMPGWRRQYFDRGLSLDAQLPR